ncbi:MAG TPA: hypothetical protein VF029_04005 [Actinomycetota bacterium]
MKRRLYPSLFAVLVVALAGLAIATTTRPSVPTAAAPVEGHLAPPALAPGT